MPFAEIASILKLSREELTEYISIFTTEKVSSFAAALCCEDRRSSVVEAILRAKAHII